MGKVKDVAKDIFNVANKPLFMLEDFVEDVTGIPAPSDLVKGMFSQGDELKSPDAPPPIPTLLTDTPSTTLEDTKKRKKAGRTQTQRTGDLSDPTTSKPTLLGG